ncbi:hypothetical protein E2320_001167 [Naja naja]|nr:hypothetical protein E2320_001167 [Naja naja]
MAREPKLSHTRPGQKRQQTASLYPSNCDLDYELYKDDLPYSAGRRIALHQRGIKPNQSTGAKESKRKLFASVDASYPAGELTRLKESARNEGQAPQQEVDSSEESTDTEEAAVRNHTPDPEGSQ